MITLAMACKDKRKVWVQVKTHQRKVLKCMDKKEPKTKGRKKKKITKPS